MIWIRNIYILFIHYNTHGYIYIYTNIRVFKKQSAFVCSLCQRKREVTKNETDTMKDSRCRCRCSPNHSKQHTHAKSSLIKFINGLVYDLDFANQPHKPHTQTFTYAYKHTTTRTHVMKSSYSFDYFAGFVLFVLTSFSTTNKTSPNPHLVNKENWKSIARSSALVCIYLLYLMYPALVLRPVREREREEKNVYTICILYNIKCNTTAQ